MELPSVRRASPYLLAALFTTTGLLHFLIPATYDAIIPSFLPAKRAITYGSGVAELACAAALVRPATRRAGALASATLLVAVYPANVQMALSAHGTAARALAYGRLPLQLPLLWWTWSVRRHSGRATVPRT